MQKQYHWNLGSRYSGSVSIVGQELEKIRAVHNGLALPKEVIKAAKKKNSPLYRYFEWDDTTAAEKWRLEQAGSLVRAVGVIYGDNPKRRPTRAYVSVEKDGERGYMEISDVMTNADLRDQLLTQALNEAESFKWKYKTLTELQSVFTAIDRVKVKRQKQAA